MLDLRQRGVCSMYVFTYFGRVQADRLTHITDYVTYTTTWWPNLTFVSLILYIPSKFPPTLLYMTIFLYEPFKNYVLKKSQVLRY